VTQVAHWGLPLAVVVVGMFMSTLDTSIVNVAIPTMQKQFGVSTTDIEWVSTAYTLCLGVIVPTSAWLGERLGLKRLYLIALISFSAFSALCGMAGDLNSMIFFRILQAIPGGVLRYLSDDPLPDGAQGQARRGHGHVWPRHRWSHRVLGPLWGVTWSSTSIGADLFTSCAGRCVWCDRGDGGVAGCAGLSRAGGSAFQGSRVIAVGLFALLLPCRRGRTGGGPATGC